MPKPSILWTELAAGQYAMSAGRVQPVADALMEAPRTADLNELITLLFDDNPSVAMRAADVLERISARPSPAVTRLFARNKAALLGLLMEATIKKTRWNLALIMGRLPLTRPEARRVAVFLEPWLDDPSSVIKTAALQGLADMARIDPSLLPSVLDTLHIRGRSGTPAMRARTRHLLAALEPDRPAKSRRPPASPTLADSQTDTL